MFSHLRAPTLASTPEMPPVTSYLRVVASANENDGHDNESALSLFSLFRDFSAGLFAGVAADAVVHPIDTIRARLQTQTHDTKAAHVKTHARLYTGTTDALLKMFRHEGPRSFYKGFGIVMLFTGPAHALYFGGYEVSKKMLPGQGTAWNHLTAGFIAEVFGATLWVPMDVVKQNLQIQGHGDKVLYDGSVDCLRKIGRTEGIRGLYKGYWASIATFGPWAALYFLGYEKCKSWSRQALQREEDADLPFAVNLGCGFVAGLVSAGITTPVDVIKTRLQTQSLHNTNSMQLVRDMMKNEGVAAFGKGLTARMLWIAPAAALTIAFYEQGKQFINHHV